MTSEEKEQLSEITRTGIHAANKSFTHCDSDKCDRGVYAGERQTDEDIFLVLKIGMRTNDRVKKRFVKEGLEAALKMASTSRIYNKLVDGEEAHMRVDMTLVPASVINH